METYKCPAFQREVTAGASRESVKASEGLYISFGPRLVDEYESAHD